MSRISFGQAITPLFENISDIMSATSHTNNIIKVYDALRKMQEDCEISMCNDLRDGRFGLVESKDCVFVWIHFDWMDNIENIGYEICTQQDAEFKKKIGFVSERVNEYKYFIFKIHEISNMKDKIPPNYAPILAQCTLF